MVLAAATVVCVLLGGVLAESALAAQATMKIGHSMNTETFRHKSLLMFKEKVEKETEGRVAVELYPSGQLGTEMETLEAVKLGTVEGFRSGGFEEAAPLLEIYSMPFLFTDVKGIHNITRGPLGEEIAKAAEPAGLLIIATGDSGLFRTFRTTSAHHETRDMKGLKIRTPPMSTIVKTMETLAPTWSPSLRRDLHGPQDRRCRRTGKPADQHRLHEVPRSAEVPYTGNYQYHAEMFYVNKDWFEPSPKRTRGSSAAAKEMMLMSDEISRG